MPKRRSIKTSSPSDFEPKRKNPIQLGSDSNLDNDFKPLKIGGESTGLEFSKGKIKSSADEFITQKEQTQELSVTSIKGNQIPSATEPQLIFQNKAPDGEKAGLWFNIYSAGTTMLKASDTSGDSTAVLLFASDFNINATEGVHISNDTGHLLDIGGTALDGETQDVRIYNTSDFNDYFKILVETNGVTTLSTIDGDASGTTAGGTLTLNADGDIVLDASGDITIDADGGDINIVDASPSASKPTITYTSTDGGGFGVFQTFYHNTASPHSNDYLLYNQYIGKNDAGEDVAYLSDFYNPYGVADGAEKGRFIKYIMANGSVKNGFQMTGMTDGSVQVNLGDGDGGVYIDSSIFINEKASALSDAGASGQIWVKNSTPNELYFTTDAGDDIQITSGTSMAGGGGSSEYYIRTTCRMRCQYNNWYWSTDTGYGENDHYFNSATGSGTSLPTSYQDSYATSWLVPRNSTVKGFKFVGTSTYGGDDTWEIALLRGVASGFGSAGNWTLSQIGSTQSVSTTTGVVEKWEETGLSVSVNANDMVLPVHRRTTDNDSSYKFLQGTYIITLE